MIDRASLEPARPARLSLMGGLVCLCLAAALAGCDKSRANAPDKAATPKPLVPVTIATAERRTVPLELDAIANVEALTSVAVKARVDGHIERVGFADGADVAAGQILFEIDRRPFEAALRQAEATQKRDAAQLENARSLEQRNRALLEKHFITQETYTPLKNNVEIFAATVEMDRAAVEAARLQLEYCTIRAPFAGRAGKVLIQAGNLVKANDTNPLVVIDQVTPIYVAFAVPERFLPEIRKAMSAGPLAVSVLPSGGEALAGGRLTFVDNAVDTTTGTIRLKATFDNADRPLWPGQFVTATVTLREQHGALVVPSSAIQNGPKGNFVFVVNAEKIAELRPVDVDREAGAETIVAHGLETGEQVVTDGQSRLKAGSPVSIQPAAPGA
ncbi:MAG: efflux RND transporter periplasmic adaptor subunit [Gammaproteobacteria bacterium]|nr:efflux RND transporter periplasmic adaptor subunit [Gammaproteobacteria bacterium]MBI5615018.1 efflux RND transporter periplasmic adaptor subunit [Gammaproteobacteria bacterium]